MVYLILFNVNTRCWSGRDLWIIQRSWNQQQLWLKHSCINQWSLNWSGCTMRHKASPLKSEKTISALIFILFPEAEKKIVLLIFKMWRATGAFPRSLCCISCFMKNPESIWGKSGSCTKPNGCLLLAFCKAV